MSEQLQNIKMKPAQPLPLGAYVTGNGIRFSVDAAEHLESTYLIIRRKKTDEQLCKVRMNDYKSCGSICSVLISGFRPDRIYYQYVRGGQLVPDPYAPKLYGVKTFGEVKSVQERAAYEPLKLNISWEEDKSPGIPLHEMVAYKLHVRGFTRHGSSGVSHKGTFAGIVEKIPYFKKLGINALILMPVFDFAEVREKERPKLPQYLQTLQASADTHGSAEGYATAADGAAASKEDITAGGPPAPEGAVGVNGYAKSDYEPETEPKLLWNCWGYGPAQFFAPKASYASGDPEIEFSNLVKALHKNGIEVILEMLFPEGTTQVSISNCLHYWTCVYHVDGFVLNRDVAAVDDIALDPMLRDIKLISEGFDVEKIYGKSQVVRRRLLCEDGRFRNTMRCYLKGDENCLRDFIHEYTAASSRQGALHMITDNNGFTLADLVSYNQKHNEDNGEDNRDGINENYSWNCGAEGKTRSRKVMELRRRQVYNAWLMLLFSQGTPMLYAGDEFGNSQMGNNNAYGQDNEIFWLNWRDLKKNQELFSFVKQAIALRREHPVLHPAKAYRCTDYLICGLPDLSLHGVSPWRVSFENEDRYIGVMYCGNYAQVDGHEDDSFYFAYNMYWEEVSFSLPVLPKDQEWEKIADTFCRNPFACPRTAPVDPQETLAEPEEVPTDPQVTSAVPERVPVDPQVTLAGPGALPADLQAAPAELEKAPVDPQETSAEPGALPADLQAVPAEPETAPVDPQAPPAESEEAPADPQTASEDAQTAPADAQKDSTRTRHPAVYQIAPRSVQIYKSRTRK